MFEEKYFDCLVTMREMVPQQLQTPIMRFLSTCGKYVSLSEAQVFQDIFVLFCTHGKERGYFVDFGATDGKHINNSYILEKHFGWTGILAEPARCWHQKLKANRSAKIDTRCVWSESDKRLSFFETELNELSTLAQFTNSDLNALRRHGGEHYDVETISLNDLLAVHDAPSVIDYMSIDTEGSEFEILSKFNFNRYRVNVFTIEHNFTENREKVRALLQAKGYVNVFSEISKWDDWFVHSSLFGKAVS